MPREIYWTRFVSRTVSLLRLSSVGLSVASFMAVGRHLRPRHGVESYIGHSELAQAALRHKSIETTHEAYFDIQAEDVAKSIDEVRE